MWIISQAWKLFNGHSDLRVLCRYIYCGQIVLCLDNVAGLFVLADKYNVDDLKSSCVQYMQRHLVDSSAECCAVMWYQYSQSCSSYELQQACFSYIILNMDIVMRSAQWHCLDHDNLVSILRRSDIIVNSEYDILEVQCTSCLFVIRNKQKRTFNAK